MSLRKSEQSNFLGAEPTFKEEVKGKVEMLRDVIQTELRDIKRSRRHMGLIRKDFLEEEPLGCTEEKEKLGLASEEAE